MKIVLFALALVVLIGCGPSEPKGSIKNQNHDDKPAAPAAKKVDDAEPEK